MVATSSTGRLGSIPGGPREHGDVWTSDMGLSCVCAAVGEQRQPTQRALAIEAASPVVETVQLSVSTRAVGHY